MNNVTNGLKNPLLRIAFFYDGNYFSTVNNYYRFSHPIKRNLNFQGLSEYIKRALAEQEDVNPELCHIVESHWFRGKFTISQMKDYHENDDKLLKTLISEKYIDDALMYANIIQHVFPMQVNKETGYAEERGIDVWFALEAFELAAVKQFEAVVLIASDLDYIPLVRKLNGLGTRIMLVAWDIESTKTQTSQLLINECSYFLPMHDEIEEMYEQRSVSDRNNIEMIFA